MPGVQMSHFLVKSVLNFGGQERRAEISRLCDGMLRRNIVL